MKRKSIRVLSLTLALVLLFAVPVAAQVINFSFNTDMADDADDEDSKSTDKAVEVKEGNVVGDWLKKIVQLLLRCS